MKRSLRVVLFSVLLLGTAMESLAMNDALWMGSKYSVAVKYLGYFEAGIDTPQPKSIQMPEYPIELMRAGVSGDVTLSFLVTKYREVREINVEQAQFAELGVAAKNAVAHWTFSPGVLLDNRSQAVTSHMRCRFEFRATEE